MKRRTLYILAASLCLGCSLDQKNQGEISGDAIINTVQKAYSVLSQAYADLPAETAYFTILSEDLQPRHTINYAPSTKAYYTWQDSEILINSADVWQKYYQSLVHINVLLATENNLVDYTEEWNYIKGNALVLKAYIYFDLLQLYSDRFAPSAPGIIAKDNIQVENNKRITQEESVRIIKSLLDQGIDLMEKHPVQANYFITTSAAKNLQAQVYLFTKEYPEAEKRAKELVDLFPDLPNSETAYSTIWDTPLQKASSAVYWIYNYQNNPNQFLYYEENKGDYFYVNHFFSFDKEDIRSHISQYLYTESDENKPEYYFLGKYKTTHTTNEARNMVLSRNTESYFILIESLIEQNKVAQAQNYLNIFLTSVNNSPLDTELSQNSLRLIMRHEKQKEFIGEKINYFDLKRWKVSIARYQTDSNNRLSTIADTDYRWTWPIPDSELRYNNNATQNEGWPTIK